MILAKRICDLALKFLLLKYLTRKSGYLQAYFPSRTLSQTLDLKKFCHCTSTVANVVVFSSTDDRCQSITLSINFCVKHDWRDAAVDDIVVITTHSKVTKNNLLMDLFSMRNMEQ